MKTDSLYNSTRRKSRTYALLLAFVCAVFTYFSPSAFAQSAEEFFLLGNGAYKSGDYKKALENYDIALAKGNASVELYYNAANAAAKSGKNGLAELYYLRAIYINPRFREASANFRLFAGDNSIAIPKEELLNSPISELSESEWTVLTFVFFWIAVGLLVIPPLSGKRHAIWVFLSILAIAAALISLVSLDKWNAFANIAVAQKDGVNIRISPTANAPIAAVVNEAQTGEIEKIFGKYGFIKLRNGKSGWANLDQFVPIAK